MTDPLFDEWRVYEKLLEHDYMDHRTFFSRLLARARQQSQGVKSILDLGCGDAQAAVPMLEALGATRYVGIDESATALSAARRNLAALDCEPELVHGDLLKSLGGVKGPFDLIVASFSLHHLPELESKQAVLRLCRALLAPEGMLAIIDVFRAEGEPRDDYINRWIDFANRHYRLLTPGEKELLFEHVRARDFPESVADYRAMGASGNFTRFDALFTDAEQLNRLVVLQ